MQMDENNELKIYRQHQIVERHSIMAMVIEEHRQIIISACQDKLIRIYNISDGKRIRSFRGTMSEEGSIVNIAIDTSGSLLACSCSDKIVYLWNLDSTESLATLTGHSEVVTSIKFVNSSSHMYTAGADSCIFIWKLSHFLMNSLRRKIKNKNTLRMHPSDIHLSPSASLAKPDLINSTSQVHHKSTSHTDRPRRRTMWSIDNPNMIISCSPANFDRHVVNSNETTITKEFHNDHNSIIDSKQLN
ncbi:hypothetical protein GJ496_008060, partial [Pomphorhynchus laevis]